MRFNREKYTNIVMHCDKKWKAEIFCRYMNAINKASNLDHKFTTENWNVTKNETCYNVYNGIIAFRGEYLSIGMKILEFDDFDWYYNPTVVKYQSIESVRCPKCFYNIPIFNKLTFNFENNE